MCADSLIINLVQFSIQDVGYNHGKTYFAGLLKAGQLPFLQPSHPTASPTPEKSFHTTQMSASGYTFTDLAQLVCKVPRNQFLDSGELLSFIFYIYQQIFLMLKFGFDVIVDSSESEYEADEEDVHEAGYASEPSAGILDVRLGLLGFY